MELGKIEGIMQGAIDFHVHAGPDPYHKRRLNVLDLALQAKAMGNEGRSSEEPPVYHRKPGSPGKRGGTRFLSGGQYMPQPGNRGTQPGGC